MLYWFTCFVVFRFRAIYLRVFRVFSMLWIYCSIAYVCWFAVICSCPVCLFVLYCAWVDWFGCWLTLMGWFASVLLVVLRCAWFFMVVICLVVFSWFWFNVGFLVCCIDFFCVGLLTWSGLFYLWWVCLRLLCYFAFVLVCMFYGCFAHFYLFCLNVWFGLVFSC